jgi:hypothetical protein
MAGTTVNDSNLTVNYNLAVTGNLTVAGATTMSGVQSFTGVVTYSAIPVFPTGGISFSTAHILTVSPGAPGQATTLTIDDVGGATGYIWTFTAAQTAAGVLSRADLAVETLRLFHISLLSVRNLDGSAVAASAAAGKFGVNTPATFGAGTTAPLLVSEVANNNTKTDVCIFEFTLPPEYVAGSAVTVNVRNQVIIGGGTLGGTKTMTLDAYKVSVSGVASANLGPSAYTLTSSDATAAFVVTPTGFVPGDRLFFQLQTAIQESASSAINQNITDINVSLSVQG